MIPTKQITKDNIIIYLYPFKNLRNFITLGLAEGNNGVILTKKEGDLITYKGFGTYEHPCKEIRTFTYRHFEPCDGKFPSIEDMQIPKKPILSTYKFVFLNFNPI